MTVDEIPDGYRIISQGNQNFKVQRRGFLGIWFTVVTEYSCEDSWGPTYWTSLYQTLESALVTLERIYKQDQLERKNSIISRLPWINVKTQKKI